MNKWTTESFVKTKTDETFVSFVAHENSHLQMKSAEVISMYSIMNVCSFMPVAY